MDEYYDRKIEQARAGKDSIFEPCKILDFDPRTMTATVFFMRSSKERKNVLVLFPSMSLTGGIVSVPGDNTTALAFWGPDRQVFVLPAQYLIGRNEVKNGVVTQSASPQNFDADLSYDHLRPGEQYLFSPGGSLHLDRDGNIELINRSMAYLRIEEDGTIRTSAARREDGTDYTASTVTDRRDGTTRVASSERTFYREEFDEAAVAARAANMARILATSRDGVDLESFRTPGREPVLVEREGLVPDGGTWARMHDGGERVVKEWAVDGVTIRIGESGSLEVGREGGVLVSVTTDDVVLRDGSKGTSVTKMAAAIRQLAGLHGIEVDLDAP